MTNWQVAVICIGVWVFLWFVWKAGYGVGYKDCNGEWQVEDGNEDVPEFQWPTCSECGEGITVHRCWKGQWQSSCDCGFAWCATPYEAMLCTHRPHSGEGSRSCLKDPSSAKKVENDVPKCIITKKDPVG